MTQFCYLNIVYWFLRQALSSCAQAGLGLVSCLGLLIAVVTGETPVLLTLMFISRKHLETFFHMQCALSLVLMRFLKTL